LDGSLAVKFRERYVSTAECQPRPKTPPPPKPVSRPKPRPKAAHNWMKGFDLRKSPPLGAILAAERAPVRRDTGEGAAAFLAANLSRPTGSFGQPPKGESGTFYFAQIRNFLLCLDTGLIYILKGLHISGNTPRLSLSPWPTTVHQDGIPRCRCGRHRP